MANLSNKLTAFIVSFLCLTLHPKLMWGYSEVATIQPNQVKHIKLMGSEQDAIDYFRRLRERDPSKFAEFLGSDNAIAPEEKSTAEMLSEKDPNNIIEALKFAKRSVIKMALNNFDQLKDTSLNETNADTIEAFKDLLVRKVEEISFIGSQIENGLSVHTFADSNWTRVEVTANKNGKILNAKVTLDIGPLRRRTNQQVPGTSSM
ncbi:MAG: hypothetical protein COT74_07605 [Bdellovibrionales bacterium CG10_big_fil_rev_8_21_14_0_10_45_34]|nr:MAG: hypothetical protein COT74_07605 [Bdellovibrionales bacterium CG10_big_fil_rev_8_21_14_0_10_45_34]